MKKKGLLLILFLFVFTACAALPAFAGEMFPRLTDLTFDTGTLAPGFAPAMLDYTLEVPAATTAVEVTPTQSGAYEIYVARTANGSDWPIVSPGMPSANVPIDALPFPIYVRVADITKNPPQECLYSVLIQEAGAPAIAVTGVSLNKKTLVLLPGEDATLAAAVSPAGATDKRVTWTASSPDIASVNGAGVVAAHLSGDSTITATTVDGGYTAECKVTVIDPSEPLLKSLEFFDGWKEGAVPAGEKWEPYPPGIFQPDVFRHWVDVPGELNSKVKVRPTAYNSDDVITVNGVVVESGTFSQGINVYYLTKFEDQSDAPVNLAIEVSNGEKRNLYQISVYNKAYEEGGITSGSDCVNIGVGTVFTFFLIGAGIPFLGRKRRKK